MKGLLNVFTSLFSPSGKERGEVDAAVLAAFRERCRTFKRLLSSNHEALQCMARMEELLSGDAPFGMHTVNELCTRTGTLVFQMVRLLERLDGPGAENVSSPDSAAGPDVDSKPAGNAHAALQARFREIGARVTEALRAPVSAPDAPPVLRLADLDASMARVAGGKAANLGEAARALPPDVARVPLGVVVTTTAFRRFMADLSEDIAARITARDAGGPEAGLDTAYALSSALQQRVTAAPLPDDLAASLREAVAALASETGGAGEGGPGVRLALRSSAVGEDAAGSSFAGQYRSVLGVSPEDAPDLYKHVVASKYGVTAMAYRLAHGLRDEDVDMAVLITAMIDARCGGVAYSTDPAGSSEVPAGSGAGRVLVHAVPGLPKAVVDGSLDVDRFELDRATLEVAHVHVAHKTARLAVDAGAGVREESLDESLADAPCLSAAEARAVARLALELERHFGCPQDVEWALDRAGVLYLLQCRPLQVRAAREARAAAPSGAVAGALALGGVAASPGAACGPVFVLRKQADALRFPQGAVLVTAQALPGWAPLLAKAAAVVTEHGSQAGHLATVAREYGVPALMGLEDACALLADAGEVTVDADRLAVLPGRDEAALARSRPRSAGLMAGSAVHEALRRAAEHVVPLRLLDPDGPDFRPENCRTLHDVTRYCHEKAVHAMFHKGGDVAFPQGASRRLSCGGKTMQYWIIDLQDGLDEAGRDRRTVRLEDVRSVPMLALWRGMTAVQWAGPPAVDAKGFMSVVVEASMNPDLDPAMGSPMAMRNYFMISRDFMSLQSRFGFHFCSVEAVIGERDEQNFACFQFKGGAASMERRVARAALVGEVMAEHGFLTEVRADNLYARIEHLPAARMEDALAILGHLIVHTRQLDMVMGSPERARAEADKLRADLAAVLGGTAP